MWSGLALVTLLRRMEGDGERGAEQPRPTVCRTPQRCAAAEFEQVGCKAEGEAHSFLKCTCQHA